MWADERRLPTSFFEDASRVVGEQALKLRQRLREGQVVTLNYIHHTAAMARGFWTADNKVCARRWQSCPICSDDRLWPSLSWPSYRQ
jgi:hypothetical protein